MANETDSNKKHQDTNLSAPSRSGLKTFALGAGAAATGMLASTAVISGVRGVANWVTGDKKETAKAALGGVSGLLKLK